MPIERLGTWLLIVLVATAFGARASPSWTWPTCAIAAVASLVPLGQLSIVDFVFSILGALSAASLVLIVVMLTDCLGPQVRLAPRLGLPLMGAFVLAGGLLLYAIEIGTGTVDAYRFGFSTPELPLGLLVILAIGWRFGSLAVACWLGLASILFLAGAFPSRNFVDYALDPAAMVIALVPVLQWLFGKSRNAATTSS